METSPPPGIDPQSFQPIASSYYAIPAALGIDGRIILKQMLNEKYGKAWNECGPGWRHVVSSSEHGSEPSGFHKFKKNFLTR